MKKPSAKQKAFCRHQILYMQVRLQSFFFFVSVFFSVFIFFDWVVVDEESIAANAIAVTPEARMRATIVFFIAFQFLVPKVTTVSSTSQPFFLWMARILFTVSPFTLRFSFCAAQCCSLDPFAIAHSGWSAIHLVGCFSSQTDLSTRVDKSKIKREKPFRYICRNCKFERAAKAFTVFQKLITYKKLLRKRFANNTYGKGKRKTQRHYSKGVHTE